MSLFTGDILALAATDKAVFTAGADGSLRRWALGKLGELSEAEVRDKAHDGRITALAVSGSLLFSAGYDGGIKVSVRASCCCCCSGRRDCCVVCAAGSGTDPRLGSNAET